MEFFIKKFFTAKKVRRHLSSFGPGVSHSLSKDNSFLVRKIQSFSQGATFNRARTTVASPPEAEKR